MRTKTHHRVSRIGQMGLSLVTLSLFFGSIVGCAAPAAQPVEQITASPDAETQPVDPATAPPTVEATLPSGWQTFASQGQCSYAISHPADLEGASQDAYSWILSPAATGSEGPFPNFVYVSVIPDGFQSSGDAIIYNYDPAVTETLLSMQVGESKSPHANPDLAPWFTYTRLADTVLGNQPAQTYENTQPWEFPAGTKEIRHYVRANGCTYLVGGYLSTGNTGEPGAIQPERFEEIMATFRINP